MLRTRLSLGLVCLCLILLAMGLYSINQCGELGQRIEKLAHDNDISGQNIQQLKRSGASMTGALLSVVTNDHAQTNTEFDVASKSFQQALDAEKNAPRPIPTRKECWLTQPTPSRPMIKERAPFSRRRRTRAASGGARRTSWARRPATCSTGWTNWAWRTRVA